MQEESLLQKFDLQNVSLLYPQISEPSYAHLFPKYIKSEEDYKKFSTGREPLFSLSNVINDSSKEDIHIEQLSEKQKKGISGIYGNPGKVSHVNPFMLKNKQLVDSLKREFNVRRSRQRLQNPYGSEIRSKLRKILSILYNKSWDECGGDNPFRPVLSEEYLRKYNLLDYLDKIEHPMSLTDMKEKLRQGLYQSIEDMAQDVLLIRNNAINYHGRNSVYARLGSELYDVGLTLS